MTGNSDENRAVGAEWLAAVQGLLAAEITAVVTALPKARPRDDADSTALDRHARAVTNIARAARAVAALGETPGPARRKAAGEDMNRKAHDISPDELEQVRQEFAVRLDRFHVALEQKRMDDGVAVRGTAGPAPGSGTSAPVGTV